MNRQQRRDLGRRLAGNDPGLTIVHSNAGGIDVGNESHFVAVPPDRDPNPVQEFGCWTADLKRMAAWLERLPDRHCGDAGHRGLLHPALRHSDRAWHSGGSGERPAHQERPRTQERCAGVSMAHEVTHLWAAARLVPAGGEDGERADDLAVARSPRERRQPRRAAHAKSAHENEHPVSQCAQRYHWGERSGDHFRDPERGARSLETGGSETRDGQGQPG